MNNKYFSLSLMLALCVVCCALGTNTKEDACRRNLAVIAYADDVVSLFPQNKEEIARCVSAYQASAQQAIDALIAVPKDQRTFANTAAVLDNVMFLSDLAIAYNVFYLAGYVSDDEAVRKASNDAALKINDFLVDQVKNNRAIYRALKEYVDGNAKNESLTDAQRYFLKQVMADFKRAGLDMPARKLAQIRKLNKKIAHLEQDFENGISQDQRKVAVSRDGLAGLDQDFIDTLKKTKNGLYLLGFDYPTYTAVMENCAVEETRKQLYRAFTNRAYAKNEGILKKVIEARDKLACLLGFASYAHYDLDDTIAQSPERAYDFLENIAAHAVLKQRKEFDALTAHLPESVTLTLDGAMKPWDVDYAMAAYKKKVVGIDERRIAEYFPAQETLERICDLYKQFFGLECKKIALKGLWHDDVYVLEVHYHGELLGYVLLDLYPRPGKYTHAEHITIIPSFIGSHGEHPLSVRAIVANFPKPSAGKPALWLRKDVKTLVHEFGHAIHGLFGRTELGAFSGTHLKYDFVEMSSTIMEQWLWDKAVLKMLSHHYLTGESLPDDMIDKIRALKQFDAGFVAQRMVMLSNLSLDCYAPGGCKDVYALAQKLYKRFNPFLVFDTENHSYASFGHLMDYAAKYYSYLWSHVYASDIFEKIKAQGLTSPQVGKRYVERILSKGGSVDPHTLLKNYLEREPNQEAFFKEMGFSR